MKKITQITITNYRAFFNEKQQPDDKPKYQIDLSEGQNLLVYGENGSGKSSLFYALSDFFESAENEEMSIEENIFTEGVEGLLEAKIEIHFSEKDAAGKWQPVHTKIEDAGTPDEKTVTIPLEFSKLAATSTGNTLLKEASHAFLSYRDMLKTYFLSMDDKTKNPNLFDLFIKVLLGSITEPSQNEQIKEELSGIESDTEVFEQIITESLSAIRATNPHDDIDEKQVREDQKGQLDEKIKNFNESLTTVLNEALTLVNIYLKKDFETNITVMLQNTDTYLELFEENGKLNLSKKLHLDIEYFEKKLEGKAYHIFLNEARLSALAICIYLAAVKKDKPTERNYKILFLDDIFIGLDMSNRVPLLEILNRDFTQYQIIMTTYDKEWFEIAKKNLNGKWKAIELYAEEQRQELDADGNWYNLGILTNYTEGLTNEQKRFFEKPLMIDPSLDYLEKANQYFRKKDYPTCANFQRKWCESFLKGYLQDNYRLELIGDDKASSITKLETLFNKLKTFYEDSGKKLPESIEKEFKLHKEMVMNPFSHDDLKSPVYKREIERGFGIIEALKKLPILKRLQVAHKGDFISLKIVTHDYMIVCELLSDLVMVRYGNEVNFLPSKLDAKGYKPTKDIDWNLTPKLRDKAFKEIVKMVHNYLQLPLVEPFNEWEYFKLANGVRLEDLKAKI